ncbi:MAG TPA: TadE/TadG family type IV pilus assembly protein [Alphaproteobacteria bacterium]|nr:TadE/TadG family type IV pilus assembly protein [Alphaproteobacteria bacterium]
MSRAGLRRDRRGAAALEFALLAPLLLALWVGAAETTRLLLAASKAAGAAQTVADLAAQARCLAEGDLADYRTAAALVMRPFPLGDGTRLALANVVFDPAGEPSLSAALGGWRRTLSGAPFPDSDFLAAARGLGEAGSGVVVARLRYTHPAGSGPFSALRAAVPADQTAVLRPRRQRLVPLMAACP